MKELTAERLREVLHYDPETGVFTRVGRSCNRWADSGRAVGCADGKGYLQVMIDRRSYKLARLAFLYMTGGMPDRAVDHINGAVSDNRWGNLRQVTVAENGQNRKLGRNNSSGFLGVHRSGPAWVARISVNGRRVYLGRFTTAEDAYGEYLSAKRGLHRTQPVPRANACATPS